MYVVSDVFQSVHRQLYDWYCVNITEITMSDENQEVPNYAWSNLELHRLWADQFQKLMSEAQMSCVSSREDKDF